MTQTLSATYQETAKKYLEGTNYSDIEQNAINEFAHHLDGFAVLDDKLQILAYQKSREIDRETIMEFYDFIKEKHGEAEAQEILMKVVNRHKHTKVEAAQEGDDTVVSVS